MTLTRGIRFRRVSLAGLCHRVGAAVFLAARRRGDAGTKVGDKACESILFLDFCDLIRQFHDVGWVGLEQLRV